MNGKGSGWHGESRRHSMARRGIKTSMQVKGYVNPNRFIAGKEVRDLSNRDYMKLFDRLEEGNEVTIHVRDDVTEFANLRKIDDTLDFEIGVVLHDDYPEVLRGMGVDIPRTKEAEERFWELAPSMGMDFGGHLKVGKIVDFPEDSTELKEIIFEAYRDFLAKENRFYERWIDKFGQKEFSMYGG